MIASYHNHTTWSDGKASVADVVESARAQRLDEVGISDHFVLHPRGNVVSWSMPIDKLDVYIEDVQSFRSSTAPVVRLGLEVDWFPNHADAIIAKLSNKPFDVLIGSVHNVNGFEIDGTTHAWQKLTQTECDELHRQYWIHMQSLAESRLFDIAAHLDLAKKFGYRPSQEPEGEINAALDAIADSDLVVELNTAGWHKACEECYPSMNILRACHERNIPVTISADAHDPAHLLRDFDRAVQWLRDAGYERIARFAQRQVSFTPLDAAVNVP